ncbi:hypothetical protein [Acinetobacter radioresistens]|uniref:hypothetical protein n=1 Tax=Acinetobacter radioresistens TaxID=40216 RepID=UPI00094631F5|nr:hypothetical protein [Acinetobacter radioresistens]
MTKHDNVSQGKIMKATEFVKKFGLGRAVEVVNGAPCADLQVYCEGDTTFYFYFVCNSLHGESAVYSTKNREWVGFHDWFCRSVNLARKAGDEMLPVDDLKQAIADVEACQ